MKKVFSILLCAIMLLTAAASFAEDGTFTGTADGYGGEIVAEVTVEGGKITGLTLTGEKETPAIGGAALDPLKEAILSAGTVDGVDAVAGATWTSKGVFAAVKNALGATEETAEAAAGEAATVSALTHGIGVVVTPRLGPGKDDQEVPVYSFNVIMAYVVADADNRIVDLEVDILEVITPNHDGAEDNYLAGWPGSVYNDDSDGDGKVDGTFEQTPENFTEKLVTWKTKRQQGSAYKMNSGTWEQEMDIFERYFKGWNAEEIQAFFAKHCSDRNGRVIFAGSTNEQDLAKWNGLTPEEQAEVDALSGATMSLSDAHGDLIGAIAKALGNQTPVTAASPIACLGLGKVVTPRLGPGKDDQDVPVYSFNVVIAGALFDAEGKIVAVKEDILEIITPNHDGAEDNMFIGWPGQQYNTDDDGDGKVDGIAEQTPETFTATLPAYRTKRDLGNLYKMNSGTWTQEMDIFEAFFAGKTLEEIQAFYAKHSSDRNGRIIFAGNTNEQDLAKWNGLTPEEQAEVDALSGATMSLNDAHGDLLGALQTAFEAVKPCEINIE
ncbi:MAG: FMN-binding protein [Clostridia bacterium]|nr:FMN-binding protein [Clostridia bacterium]